MSVFDWTRITACDESISEIYSTPLPPGNFYPNYLQVDERDTSVTLAFETSDLPTNPPVSWRDREYNTVEFYLRFSGVEHLLITGWDASIRDSDINLTSHPGGGVRLSIESTGSHLSFTASTVALTRVRTYLSARSD